MTLEELRWEILDCLAGEKRYAKKDIVEAEEIAERLNIGLDYVHEELDKMELLGWVKLYKSFGPRYSAGITPKGLITHEQAGKD
ncbi:hypothetical protein M1N57_00835 [Dehalococcoidales bacterium]|nr:hypothetical protein [Dehalococcoidales bacterium]